MNYLKIHTASLCDGLGVRVVLFVSGCTHYCKGCHNPESWDKNAGKLFTTETMEKLMELIKKPYIKGLTLSGGDPLAPYNIDTTSKITEIVKLEYPEKDIWLYTGYQYKDIVGTKFNKAYRTILDYVDYIVDGEFDITKKSLILPFRGSKNQHIIKLHA